MDLTSRDLNGSALGVFPRGNKRMNIVARRMQNNLCLLSNFVRKMMNLETVAFANTVPQKLSNIVLHWSPVANFFKSEIT